LSNRVTRRALPIHLFRHCCCRMYHLATMHSVTGRQTDRRTDRQRLNQLLLHYHQPAHTLRSSSQLGYNSISRRQGSTFNTRHSASRHQMSGTLTLQLLKVPLPSPHSRHRTLKTELFVLSLLHTTRGSNISYAADDILI